MKTSNCEISFFRFSVIGQLTSRGTMAYGELKKITMELSQNIYQHPNGENIKLSPGTIERWYYLWRKGGLDGLTPQVRSDRGGSVISSELQQIIIETKKECQSRSLDQLILHLEILGVIEFNAISRSSIHRLLRSHNLSKRVISNSEQSEKRSFEALKVGDIWYSDVMHGPKIQTEDGLRKSYLISFMDDHSRLICHSVFASSECHVAVEMAFKQALMKRGIPRKLVVDNGSAYIAKSFKWICARLGINLIHCKPYSPEGKGKIERWHRTVRSQFLNEIDLMQVKSYNDINIRLNIWVEKFYHVTKSHAFKPPVTPQEKWRDGLINMQQVSSLPKSIDEYFYHEYKRSVSKDGCISYEGSKFEVPYELSGSEIIIIICKSKNKIMRVESVEGKYLGLATPLNKYENLNRKRQQAKVIVEPDNSKHKKTVEEALKKYL